MEHRGGHIIRLHAIPGEFLDRRENMVQESRGGIARLPPADILDSAQIELPAVDIPRIGQSIGAKQNGITRHEVEREFVIGNATVQSWREPGELQDATFVATDEQGAEHASARNAHLGAKRIKDGVLNRAIASYDAAEEQPLVQEGKNLGRGLAGLVDAAQRPHRKRRIERCRKAFPAHVA
jgi:hypothetical protein